MSDPATLNELFFQAMDRWRDRPVLLRARREKVWTDISAREMADCVFALSLGFLELDAQPGDRIGILSENRPEWAYADFAALTARCIDVPIYPTLPAGQVEFMLRDAGVSILCVSTATQLEKIRSIRANLPDLRHIIVFDDGVDGEDVMPVRKLMHLGRAETAEFPTWGTDAAQAQPDDVATIIYTSGTTGDPKGVMLTHRNLTSNAVESVKALGVNENDECLSFLPLSHIFERLAGHYVMLHAGALINYCRSVDAVATDLIERSPTVLTAVPRLYEKIHEKLLDLVKESGGIKVRVFEWARRTALEWADLTLGGKVVPAGLKLRYWIADQLVFTKLRRRTGGRLRCSVSGGAPLNPELARFFYAAGMPILEGYGLTETSPVIAVNTFSALRLGSVGRPLKDVEVLIAADGEILARGPNIMKGYFNRPDATAEAITPDGWFKTGDVGKLDADGFLYITDRKKDLIVTAGGKNIAPQPIEGRLKTNPFIATAVMLGDKRKFPILLLVPNFEKLRAWAKAEGLGFGDDAALVALPAVQAKMEQEAKKHLRDLAQFEVPKKFLVLPRDFSIETGELTPKMSVKRKVVEQKYRKEIEELYGEQPSGELAS
ncbi:MAG TPA: long-chain fatty acid--CoA ligase [Gemmatimonadales bacterium]|nr:long-chain fatty acid--CoA ligase [Gemmatimonadales bacterium]